MTGYTDPSTYRGRKNNNNNNNRRRPPRRRRRAGPTRWSLGRGPNNNNNNNNNNKLVDFAAWSLPPFSLGLCLRVALGVTVTLYVLNQKHLLLKPISAVVSKTLFWPTLPITAALRIGTWTTIIDDTVIMGGAPFGFAGLPERLHDEYGVTGVVNMCAEYNGPVRKYERLGMKQLHLPTVDHFEPTTQDLKRAVAFIRKHQIKGHRVYVHCRAGHGRSAAVVFSWLLYNYPMMDRRELNAELCRLRRVRRTLWKQRSIGEFHRWVKRSGVVVGNSVLAPPPAGVAAAAADSTSSGGMLERPGSETEEEEEEEDFGYD